jgi:hypothetical protein
MSDGCDDEVTSSAAPASAPMPILPMQPVLTGLLQAQAGLTDAVNYMAQMQAAHMRASFVSMPLDQRDTYCQVMIETGVVTPKALEGITGMSYSTINRHINGKNS